MIVAMGPSGSHWLTSASQVGICWAGNRIGAKPMEMKTSAWVMSCVVIGLVIACAKA